MPLDVSDEDRKQLMVTYACLILHDDGIAITPEKIQNLIQSAGGQIEAYWAKLFARSLEGKDINQMLLGAVASGPAAAPATAASDSKAPVKEESKKEEKKKEVVEEESEEDMGMSLFD